MVCLYFLKPVKGNNSREAEVAKFRSNGTDRGSRNCRAQCVRPPNRSNEVEDSNQQRHNIELLNRFYAIFAFISVVFLTIGVPFVFQRKAASAVASVILIAIVLAAWRMSRHGRPQLSLKIFSSLLWVLLLIIIGFVIFGVAYTWRSILSTPNW